MVTSCKIRVIKNFEIPDPVYGDLKLSVMPFEHNGGRISLPTGFKMWEESLNLLMREVPLVEGANTHYVTIDSKFFSKSGFLRRDGVHIDGNFCVDPKFNGATWGGVKALATWGGAKFDEVTYKAKMDWVLPYDIEIPIGDYVSKDKGGIFVVSTEMGCVGWEGEFSGGIGSEGDVSHWERQLTYDKEINFRENVLYFMTSNTPHATLLIDKGKRRTLMRVTLNHEYPNSVLPCMQ
jgi:hypothetical protein